MIVTQTRTTLLIPEPFDGKGTKRLRSHTYHLQLISGSFFCLYHSFPLLS